MITLTPHFQLFITNAIELINKIRPGYLHYLVMLQLFSIMKSKEYGFVRSPRGEALFELRAPAIKRNRGWFFVK